MLGISKGIYRITLVVILIPHASQLGYLMPLLRFPTDNPWVWLIVPSKESIRVPSELALGFYEIG